MNPSVKRLAIWASVIVVVLFVVSQPDNAADVFRTVFDGLRLAANSVIRFVTGVFQ